MASMADSFDVDKFTHELEESVARAHERAHDSISQSVMRLVEHAGQVQAKVEVEMGSLQRAGSESARQLTRELREVRDRCIAANIVVKNKEQEVARLLSVQVELERRAEEAAEQLKKERSDRRSVQDSFQQLQTDAAADMEHREAQHAESIAQIAASHAAAIDVLKRQRSQEIAQHAARLAEAEAEHGRLQQKIGAVDTFSAALQNELKEELRKHTDMEQKHASEMSALKDELAIAQASVHRLEDLTKELVAQQAVAEKQHRDKVDELHAASDKMHARAIAAEKRAAKIDGELKSELKLSSEREKQYGSQMAELKETMAAKLEELGASLAASHSAELESTAKAHAAEIEALISKKGAESEAAAEAHSNAIKELQKARATEIRDLQNRHAADAQRLTELLATADREHAAEIRAHQERLASSNTVYATDLRHQDEQLTSAKNEVRRLQDKLDNAEATIRTLESEAKEVVGSTATKLRDADAVLAKERAATAKTADDLGLTKWKLTALEATVADLKEKAAATEMSHQEALEGHRTRAEKFSSRITEVEDELSLANRAARLAAEDASKEICELKETIRGLEETIANQQVAFQQSAGEYEAALEMQKTDLDSTIAQASQLATELEASTSKKKKGFRRR